MARTNINATRVKPESSELLTLQVVRREQATPHMARVTLGGGDIARFRHMGFDQWFRLFIPVSEESLSRLPQKLDMLAYMRFLAIAKTDRPVLRNYTVRSFREDGPDGPELDVDFVLHGSAEEGTAGPAATWAQSCQPGDSVAILDEGITFTPAPELARHVLLVTDETGLPAAGGILSSLPRDARGTAVIEIPSEGDRQELGQPEGVDVRWVVRTDHAAVPGVAALAEASALPIPAEPFYAWAVGEQSLPAAMRRHWVRAGVPKGDISFCGYWRHSARH